MIYIKAHKINAAIIKVLAVFFALSLLIFPKSVAAGAKEGMLLCFTSLIPSLFPFFVATSLLSKMSVTQALSKVLSPVTRLLFRVDGAGAPAIISGLLGGYPTGVKSAMDLYESGRISKTDAQRLILFCNNASPAFLIGAIGVGMLANEKYGLIIYLCHISASLLLGAAMSFFAKPDIAAQKLQAPPTEKGTFFKSITSGGAAVLNVCAYVVFFKVLVEVAGASGILEIISLIARALLPKLSPAQAAALISGIVELTSGCAQCVRAFGNANELICALTFLVSFGGMSIFCQSLSMFSKDVSKKKYFYAKIAGAFLSLFIAKIYLTFFPITVSAFAPPKSVYENNVYTALALCVFIAALNIFALLMQKNMARFNKRSYNRFRKAVPRGRPGRRGVSRPARFSGANKDIFERM